MRGTVEEKIAGGEECEGGSEEGYDMGESQYL